MSARSRRALAGLVGLSGLALWELVAFWLLEPLTGRVAVAALLGVVNFIVTAGLLLIVGRKAHRSALTSALQMRQSAILRLEQDLAPNRLDALSYPVRPAIELLAAVLVPLAAALLRSVRSRAGKPDRGRDDSHAS